MRRHYLFGVLLEIQFKFILLDDFWFLYSCDSVLTCIDDLENVEKGNLDTHLQV